MATLNVTFQELLTMFNIILQETLAKTALINYDNIEQVPHMAFRTNDTLQDESVLLLLGASVQHY